MSNTTLSTLNGDFIRPDCPHRNAKNRYLAWRITTLGWRNVFNVLVRGNVHREGRHRHRSCQERALRGHMLEPHSKKKTARGWEYIGQGTPCRGFGCAKIMWSGWYISHSPWINVSPILRRCIKSHLKIAVVDVLEYPREYRRAWRNVLHRYWWRWWLSRSCGATYIFFFFQYNSYRWTFIAYVRITSAKRAIFAPIIFQSINCVIRHKNVARFRQIWETKSKWTTVRKKCYVDRVLLE